MSFEDWLLVVVVVVLFVGDVLSFSKVFKISFPKGTSNLQKNYQFLIEKRNVSDGKSKKKNSFVSFFGFFRRFFLFLFSSTFLTNCFDFLFVNCITNSLKFPILFCFWSDTNVLKKLFLKLVIEKSENSYRNHYNKELFYFHVLFSLLVKLFQFQLLEPIF